MDRALKDGYTWVVDADLQSYFDTIPKQPMLALVREKVSGKVQEARTSETTSSLVVWGTGRVSTGVPNSVDTARASSVLPYGLYC